MGVLKLHASLAVHIALKVQDSTNYNLASEGCENHSVVSNSLRSHGLYNPWKSPGQNTGVGSLSLLQGLFLQNPGDLNLGIKSRSPALQATREALGANICFSMMNIYISAELFE